MLGYGYPLGCLRPHDELGAMLPFFGGRVGLVAAQPGEVTKLTKPPLQYFKKFYDDTVLGGNTPALMCGYAFFGAEHMLFGTDAPYDSMGGGARVIPATIRSVEEMEITDEERKMIFQLNAQKLFRLPI